MSGLYADPERDRALVRTALMNAGFSSQEAEQRLEGRYEPQTLMCELRTLSPFLREEQLERIDLLKIHVERAELDVVGGIEECDWPKIDQLAVEVHDEGGRCAANRGRACRTAFPGGDRAGGPPCGAPRPWMLCRNSGPRAQLHWPSS
jgi:hypothetical protein